MARYSGGRRSVGAPPGTIEYSGEQRVDQIRIRFFDYDEERLEEKEVTSIEECFELRERESVSWINLDGLHDTETIQSIGNRFGLHPLLLEDVVHTTQRPKLEEYEDHMFLVLRMLRFDSERKVIHSEQLSLVLGPGFVISFQEIPGDVFEGVRARIRSGKGRIRKSGADYLTYALADAVVDSYFVLLERLGEEIEEIERELVEDADPAHLPRIHHLKRELILLRRSIWPLRELLSGLIRVENPLITDRTQLFLRDVYDHAVQVVDTVESFRDMASGLQDLFLSSVSNRMNEVMKVLTIIATIFVPLTFLAGIYGMNFEHMPETKWSWSYPVFWIVTLVAGASMLVAFRRKHWI